MVRYGFRSDISGTGPDVVSFTYRTASGGIPATKRDWRFRKQPHCAGATV